MVRKVSIFKHKRIPVCFYTFFIVLFYINDDVNATRLKRTALVEFISLLEVFFYF